MDVTRIGQSVPIGSPMDPMDHPADSGHNNGFNPGRTDNAPDAPVADAMDQDFRRNATNQTIKPGKTKPGF